MNSRDALKNNEPVEFEAARQMPNQQHSEPYIHQGNQLNFSQPSVHQILPPGNIHNIDNHGLPEDGTTLYRSPQYPHQVLPVGNLELGVPTPSSIYNPYLNPASDVRMFPGPTNQLSSSSNFGATATHINGYGMNSFAPEDFRGLSKRNGLEGYMGNFQYFNVPSAPTVSVPPMNVGHDAAIINACNPMPLYRGNYVSPSFQPPHVTWRERQPSVDDSGILSFTCPATSPYFEASNDNGNSSTIGNTGPQRFHEGASSSRGSLNLLPYVPMLHPVFHPQNIHSRYSSNYGHPAAPTSTRHPVYNTMQYAGISHPQQGHDAVPVPPGMRIYRSHRRNSISEGVQRHRNLPHFRFLQEDEVAILEFSGHYETSSPIDHHRDMRLDIDYMSYEELLALTEWIGDAKNGLSEEVINAHLKTRAHKSSMGTINLEEPPCSEHKKDSCVICQEEYEENDKIGSLVCGHEYHVDCLKKWLLVKNSCPICKLLALDVDHKSG